MSRLLILLRWDLVMQYRYGFWLAAAGVTALWVAGLQPLSPEYLEIWLPCVLYFDIGVIGLMFMPECSCFSTETSVGGPWSAEGAVPLPCGWGR